MTEWRPNAIHWHGFCQFERDNPEPPPEPCDCPNCGCDNDWYEIDTCGGSPAYLVQLADGSYFRSCCADAHGHETLWVAPVYRFPQFEGPWDQMMRMIYREERVTEMAAQTSPFMAWIAKTGKPEEQYGYIPIEYK